jgi:hypothetical protein
MQMFWILSVTTWLVVVLVHCGAVTVHVCLLQLATLYPSTDSSTATTAST